MAGTLWVVAALSNLDPARFAVFRHTVLTGDRAHTAAPGIVRLEHHAECLR